MEPEVLSPVPAHDPWGLLSLRHEGTRVRPSPAAGVHAPGKMQNAGGVDRDLAAFHGAQKEVVTSSRDPLVACWMMCVCVCVCVCVCAHTLSLLQVPLLMGMCAHQYVQVHVCIRGGCRDSEHHKPDWENTRKNKLLSRSSPSFIPPFSSPICGQVKLPLFTLSPRSRWLLSLKT